MTFKEAQEQLVGPLAISNGDENDPIQKHWIAYKMALHSFEAMEEIKRVIEMGGQNNTDDIILAKYKIICLLVNNMCERYMTKEMNEDGKINM